MKRFAPLFFCVLAQFSVAAVADEAKPEEATADDAATTTAPAPTPPAPTGGGSGDDEPGCE